MIPKNIYPKSPVTRLRRETTAPRTLSDASTRRIAATVVGMSYNFVVTGSRSTRPARGPRDDHARAGSGPTGPRRLPGNVRATKPCSRSTSYGRRHQAPASNQGGANRGPHRPPVAQPRPWTCWRSLAHPAEQECAMCGDIIAILGNAGVRQPSCGEMGRRRTLLIRI